MLLLQVFISLFLFQSRCFFCLFLILSCFLLQCIIPKLYCKCVSKATEKKCAHLDHSLLKRMFSTFVREGLMTCSDYQLSQVFLV